MSQLEKLEHAAEKWKAETTFQAKKLASLGRHAEKIESVVWVQRAGEHEKETATVT